MQREVEMHNTSIKNMLIEISLNKKIVKLALMSVYVEDQIEVINKLCQTIFFSKIDLIYEVLRRILKCLCEMIYDLDGFNVNTYFPISLFLLILLSPIELQFYLRVLNLTYKRKNKILH